MLFDHVTNDDAFFAAYPARLLRFRHHLSGENDAPGGNTHVLVFNNGRLPPVRMFFAAAGAEAAALGAACEDVTNDFVESTLREIEYKALRQAWGYK